MEKIKMDCPNKPVVLIVEDDRAYVYMLQNILENEGYEIIITTLGEEALEKLETIHPDVILLDLILPSMDGLEVLEKITTNKETEDIPVVVISAKTGAKDVAAGLEKGAIDYIKKPTDDVELRARIRTAIRVKKHEDELRNLVTLKSDIVQIISHDLKTPFTSVLGYARLLQTTENLSDRGKKYVNSIIQATNRVLDYSNKLLNMAYLQSGKLELKREKVDLEPLVNQTGELFSLQLEEKNLKLEVDIPHGSFVIIDSTLFSQVLTNLISNAIKYTEPGGEIKATTERNNGSIILKIADTGIGIDESIKGKLFEEFVKSRRKGTAGEIGTGLGLNICKKIIDAHSFGIDYTSKKGDGTEFRITMPE